MSPPSTAHVPASVGTDSVTRNSGELLPSNALFDASVPVFQRYLRQLQGLLNSASAYLAQTKLPEAYVLEARLAPDMLPLAVQVEIAVNFVFRACAPLAGQAVPPLEEHRDSLAALQARVAQGLQYLNSLSHADMAHASGRTISDPAGQTTVTLDASTFLHQYAMPNFFFHVSMVYALLRSLGLPLSKGQFDGWHQYGAPAPRETN
ncbi:DUF1993 domain-containing protein [Rhodoferax aquaticus]|uniref:DUF1993 domain-containing protein n=1 Tax=Rhodoferax aquaticus TaxID=2527691 RepID=A0A515ESK6_9BURK|nr:DUF1993 domain-containing protein [Rhodoferax aquaticus]QDL55644.1 DUF1993 domain-containing protein [Rhodoferax aquaticus]